MFFKSLNFFWLAFLVVLAEFQIVLLRFVFSYEQTLKIQEILIRNNKYSEVMFFENEGHGFKNIENKKVVMQKSQQFLKNALNI